MNLRKNALVFILCLGLAACSAGGDGTLTANPIRTPSAVTTAAAVTPATVTGAAPTLPPATEVPTPAQGRVLLVAPPDTSGAPAGASAEAVRGAISNLAGGAGLAFETRSTLRAEEIQAGVKVVVFLQAPPDLAALRAAAPQAQFAAVDPGGELEAGGNLSVIRQREELRTFLAGYITTIIAPDWRAVGLLPDAPANLKDAFINGGRYWCGRCIPIYAPLVLFPLAGTQPGGTDAPGWLSALQPLQKNVLEAVYISPAAHSPDLLVALSAQKLILVGVQPPGAEAKARWAATLSFDPLPAIKKLWPDLVAGKGGQAVDASLSWTDVNADLFTVGRQRLAKETLDGLLDGTISPFSVPGE